VSANVGTLGVATALRKKCGVCGHPLTAHTGQVVAVTNQQQAAPIIIATQQPPAQVVIAPQQAQPRPIWPPVPPPPLPDGPQRPTEISAPGAAESLAPEPALPPPAPEPRSVADELKKLAELRDAGILTEEEFAAQKARLLQG